MSITPFKLTTPDVTDPSDFKTTKISALSELDNLKRCFICKEFFKAPVITSCNHTFCSQCIREYLINYNNCPLCKTEVFESTLKRDVLLEEVVNCYVQLRPFLLKYLQSDESGEEEEEEDEQKGDTDTRKRMLEEEIIEISDSESDQIIDNKRRKSQSPEEISPSSEDLVTCPVCSSQMSAEVLQTSHLDDCLSGKVTKKYIPKVKKNQPKNSISSFFKPRTTTSSNVNPPEKLGNEQYYFKQTSRHNPDIKRLPKLDFSSLITPKLKEKLTALNLPTHGTRNQLELRYNQYFVLYNSNLDSNRPVSEKILKQKLNQWELSHREFNTYNGGLFTNRGISHKSITDKNFSVSEWMKEYKQDFKQLIKIAQASVKKNETPNTVDIVSKVSYNTDISSYTNDNSLELPGNNDTVSTNDTPVMETGATKAGEADIEIGDLDFASSPLFSDSISQK